MPKIETTETIECPECHHKFSLNIDDVLRKQIGAELQAQYEAKESKDREILKEKEAKLAKQAEELKAAQENTEKTVAEAVAQQKAALAEEKVRLEEIKQTAEEQIAAQVKAKLAAGEQNLRQRLKQEAETEQAQKFTAMTELLADKDSKLKSLRESEASLMKAKAELQEQNDNLEAENLKKLEAEKEKIKTAAELKANETYELILAQKDKQLADSRKNAEELQRKLEQGSQQMQGEVLELSLEEQLHDKFIYDEIAPVPKGINGADIIQTVRSGGSECGQIIWEAKNTKAWSQGWIQKLKADQRELHADIAIIVSEALPEEVKSFAPIEGVWVCSRRYALPLAALIRDKLEAIARERKLAIGKNEKIELLYQYLTGNQFRQRIEAIVENFAALQEDLAKEKRYFKKKWAATEKRLEVVLDNTACMASWRALPPCLESRL